MMPKNYLLIRHGESEGNVAVEASKRGDDRFYANDDFVTTPGTQWRLTPTGVLQANAIGAWVAEHAPTPDRYYVSPYVRTRMTAAQLRLPAAQWRLNRAYREREWGEIETIAKSQFERDYPISARLKKYNPLYWCPPGGESIAEVAENRVRNILDTLHRECSEQTVLAVAHGETMWAHRLVLERWNDETFKAHDDDKEMKIHNCQLLWYSMGEGEHRLSHLKVVTPLLQKDGTWQAQVTREEELSSPTYSNDELWAQVEDVPSFL